MYAAFSSLQINLNSIKYQYEKFHQTDEKKKQIKICYVRLLLLREKFDFMKSNIYPHAVAQENMKNVNARSAKSLARERSILGVKDHARAFFPSLFPAIPSASPSSITFCCTQ